MSGEADKRRAARDRGPRSRTVRVAGGRRLRALTWSGTGQTVVLLHGLLDAAEGWSELARATTRPCVAIDLPGFGGSDLPRRAAVGAYAEDICTALDRLLGPDATFVLVGHSLGGAVATAVAERIPARVRALVLLAPAGFGRIPLAEAVSMPGVRLVAERVLPVALGNRLAVTGAYRVFVANGHAPSGELVARVTGSGATSAVGAREATKAVVRAGLSQRAFHRRRVGYDGHVTLVWGDRDRVVPPGHVAGVATAFPHVDASVWRGMGHHPQHERPAELAALIEAVCRRTADTDRRGRGRGGVAA